MAFRPDFWLPEHRLYIELTTLRQELVTRKNRKLRLLQRIYPDVQIKMLYRRDYTHLLLKAALAASASPQDRLADPSTVAPSQRSA